MFSLYLSNKESWAWFGGYDTEFILNAFPKEFSNTAEVERNIAWVPILPYRHKWAVTLDSVSLTDGTRISTAATTAHFDSGTSTSYIPRNKYAIIKRRLASLCDDEGFCYCNDLSKFPVFILYMGQMQVKFTPTQYLRFYSSSQKCRLMLASHTDQWRLGNSFLRSYVTIYDADRGRIGFAGTGVKVPDDGKQKIVTPVRKIQLTSKPPLNRQVKWIIPSALGAMICLIFLCTCCTKCCV